MSDPSWRPDEDSNAIHAEETWIQGALLMCIAYGAVATLCFQCFTKLATQIKRPNLLCNGILLTYVALTFSLATIFIGAAMKFTQDTFVYGCHLPGGVQPGGKCSTVVTDLANVTLVLSIFLSDIVPLWRCVVLYKNCSVPKWVSILLCSLIWLTGLILGALLLGQGTPTTIFGISETDIADFTRFWCLSLALNALSAVAVVTRLFVYRGRFRDSVPKQHVKRYTGIDAMIAESGLLYIVVLIIFIAARANNSPLIYTFVQPLSLVHATSTLMIIKRIAEGRAWMNNTYAQLVRGNDDLPNNHSTFQAASFTTHNGEDM